jgi:predicted ATPase
VVAPLATPNGDGLSSASGTAAPMITKVEIENYKSIRKLTLELGRMNVFIGENGCGKTNILEAITLGSAASRGKLDNEYLVPRGIRVTKPELMRSAFDTASEPVIVVRLGDSNGARQYKITLDEMDGRARWLVGSNASSELARHLLAVIFKDVEPSQRGKFIESMETGALDELRTLGAQPNLRAALALMMQAMADRTGELQLEPDFIYYAPENTVLRRFEDETAIGLGVRGEGLFQHLQDLSAHPDAPAIAEINEQLALLDWFERFEVPSRDMAGRALRIRDRYLAEGVVFDQKSANEGFLFLLFYLTLFISPHTSRFFAIDNVDASLNPKLCQALMASMVKLAKQHDKQAIVTTHNPSLLDGLDLHDDEQRLFAVSRGLDGETRIRRVSPPKPLPGDEPVRLSEAFINGFIGGLPKNF